MVRYLRKYCKGLGEEAVMERKRKAGSVEAQLSTSSSQLKTRRVEVATSKNSASSASCENSTTCEAADHAPASCCSSNGSSEATERSSKFVDLEENEVTPEFCGTSVGDDSLDCRKRREKTPMTESQADHADELESTATPRGPSYRRRPSAEKMPSEAELEEFFSAAETNLQKQFAEKYNYDIVKDQPLEGRYEWVQVQQKP